MRREIFNEDHDLFREQVRRFVAEEVEPNVLAWNEAGIVPRSAWKRMGEEGFLGANMPEEYGGAGADFLYDAIIMEELAYARAHALQASLHTDICLPYLASYGTEEQKQKYLVPAIAGDCLVSIGMTEPGTGSDLANVRSTAIREGDHYVLNGAKTFISNGQNAHLCIVVAKTDPEKRHDGISLLLVETDSPGFEKGRNLDKIGLKGQDTSELFFRDVRVPVENLLGQEGQGFKMLMEKLQQERLCISIGCMASVRRSLDDTIAYVKEREAFGQPIAGFQNTQFKLAELATEVRGGAGLRRQAVSPPTYAARRSSPRSRMAKWWTTDLQKKVAAECLQLHGGYGFMSEYPISGDYAGCRRCSRIYAGLERDHEGDHRAAHGAGVGRAAAGVGAEGGRRRKAESGLTLSGAGRPPRLLPPRRTSTLGEDHSPERGPPSVGLVAPSMLSWRSLAAMRQGSPSGGRIQKRSSRTASRVRSARTVASTPIGAMVLTVASTWTVSSGRSSVSSRFRWAGRLRSAWKMRVFTSSGHSTETPTFASRAASSW